MIPKYHVCAAADLMNILNIQRATDNRLGRAVSTSVNEHLFGSSRSFQTKAANFGGRGDRGYSIVIDPTVGPWLVWISGMVQHNIEAHTV
jgi:hypothetical protein